MNPDLEQAMMTLQPLVEDRLRTLIEWLSSKGLNELEAINLILDAGELLLDELPMLLSHPTANENQPNLPGIL